MIRNFLTASALALIAALPAGAATVPVAAAGTEGYVVRVADSVTDVVVTLFGGDAGFTNIAYFMGTSPVGLTQLFSNRDAAGVTHMNLGTFAAGTELVFMMQSSGGHSWITGPSSRASGGSADTIAHARAQSLAGNNVIVSWEDLMTHQGGYDGDYNDLSFGVSNAYALPAVPLPAALPLFAGALGLLGLLRRRRS